MFRWAVSFVLTTLLVAPVWAQSNRSGTPPAKKGWDFWVKGNTQLFENFFQAPEGQPQDDVSALYGELGASVGLTNALDAYGNVNLLHFNDDTLENSPGIRAGIRGDMKPHAFDVYAEQLSNRPSFDVGDEFDPADIRRIAGEYSYRFLEDWQVSVDGDMEKQEFERTTARDNDFAALGAAVRWRGSRLFSPEIGFRSGQRDVQDDAQSYDQRDAYVQIRSLPTPKLYLSLRYRNRLRDYQNIAREDRRHQWAAGADYTINSTWVVNLYGAKETNDSNIAGRDFDIGFWLAGVTFRF